MIPNEIQTNSELFGIFIPNFSTILLRTFGREADHMVAVIRSLAFAETLDEMPVQQVFAAVVVVQYSQNIQQCGFTAKNVRLFRWQRDRGQNPCPPEGTKRPENAHLVFNFPRRDAKSGQNASPEFSRPAANPALDGRRIFSRAVSELLTSRVRRRPQREQGWPVR